MPYYLEYLALGKEFCAGMSLRDYCTIKYGSWPEDLDEDAFNGTKRRLKEEKQEVWEELVQAHSHVEDHASNHDEKVSGEEDQAMVHDELMGFFTGIDDEGATSCPTYDDYEDDDTTPCAPLALSYEAHDTDTYDRQVDGKYTEDAYDDDGVPTPIYDEHSTSHPTLYSYENDDDDQGMRIPTYDGGWMFEGLPWDMGPSSQEPCVEDDVMHESHHSMVSPSALGDDGEERHCRVAGGVTSAQLRIDKEALEQLKSNYLQLLMDRDLALKFVEEKDCEVGELHYQLSLVCSSPLQAKTPSDLVAASI
jgi:hypothetical protein